MTFLCVCPPSESCITLSLRQHCFSPSLRVPVLSPPHLISDGRLSVCVHTEILDFGYPQNSETGALKTFITQQGIKGQVSKTSLAPKLNCIVLREQRCHTLLGTLTVLEVLSPFYGHFRGCSVCGAQIDVPLLHQ